MQIYIKIKEHIIKIKIEKNKLIFKEIKIIIHFMIKPKNGGNPLNDKKLKKIKILNKLFELNRNINWLI